MKKQKAGSFSFRYMERLVGFFVLIGILILFVTVILMGREQKWFQSKDQYYTIFNNASGLSSGMDVRIKGLNVGRVERINFSEDNRVKVEFSIYEEFSDKINSASHVFKQSSSILGGGFLDVTISTGWGRAIEPGSKLYSEDHHLTRYNIAMGYLDPRTTPLDNIITSMDKLFAELADDEGDLMEGLKNIEILTAMLVDSSGSLESFLNDDNALYREVLEALTTVRRITHDIQVLSATLRNTSPSIQNTILEAEQGLKETTRVMVGIQQYLDIQRSQADTTRTDYIEPISIDRRGQTY